MNAAPYLVEKHREKKPSSSRPATELSFTEVRSNSDDGPLIGLVETITKRLNIISTGEDNYLCTFSAAATFHIPELCVCVRR